MKVDPVTELGTWAIIKCCVYAFHYTLIYEDIKNNQAFWMAFSSA